MSVIERLSALRQLRFAPGQRISALDHIASLAKRHFNVPIALVTLLERDQQCFAGNDGLPIDGTPIEQAFCRFAVEGDDVMVVEDARNDPRFCSNPLVTGEPFIRFYAGAPLKFSDNVRIGTVCIIDRVPRALNVGQRIVLKQLASVAMSELKSLPDEEKAYSNDPEQARRRLRSDGIGPKLAAKDKL